MNRRSILKGGLVSIVAALIPVDVLSRATEMHDVRIRVNHGRHGTDASMILDGKHEVSLSSFVIEYKIDQGDWMVYGNGGKRS